MNHQRWGKALPAACFGLTLLALAPAHAALTAYLSMKANGAPIQGGVTQKGREGKIAVIAFDHEIKSPTDLPTGLPTGKAQHGTLTITKELDKSTPLLYQALVGNQTLSDWELQCWRPNLQAGGTGSEQQHYTVKLEGARVVGIRQRMPNNKNPELMRFETYEEVTFSYQSIEWIWIDGGISAKGSVR
jgi:type VI secretion system secreted protein Hcp